MNIRLDWKPKGYSTHERWDGEPCPSEALPVTNRIFGCGCAMSLEPRFRHVSRSSMERLEARLRRLRKRELVALLHAVGKIADVRERKDDLVGRAVMVQMNVWFPVRTVQRAEVAR